MLRVRDVITPERVIAYIQSPEGRDHARRQPVDFDWLICDLMTQLRDEDRPGVAAYFTKCPSLIAHAQQYPDYYDWFVGDFVRLLPEPARPEIARVMRFYAGQGNTPPQSQAA